LQNSEQKKLLEGSVNPTSQCSVLSALEQVLPGEMRQTSKKKIHGARQFYTFSVRKIVDIFQNPLQVIDFIKHYLFAQILGK